MGMNRSSMRTIDILELISGEPKGISLSEIAAALSIPVTSASDIIRALLEKEMIEIIDERSKLYGIGVKAYYIGNSFISNTSLVDKAKDSIEELGTKTNKTVFLGKLVNNKITYIYKFEPKDLKIATCAIGSNADIHSTSLGKCMLAHDFELLTKIMNSELKRKTVNTIVDAEELKKEIDIVRRQGYGLDNCEEKEHLLCIGAPIFDNNGKVIAAISISDLYSEDTNIEHEAIIVKESALIISRKMGFTGPVY